MEIYSTIKTTSCNCRIPKKSLKLLLSLPRKLSLSSSSSKGMEKHPHVYKEQQQRRSNPNTCFPAVVTSSDHFPHREPSWPGDGSQFRNKATAKAKPSAGLNLIHTSQRCSLVSFFNGNIAFFFILFFIKTHS